MAEKKEAKKEERPFYEMMAVQAREAFIQVADKKTWEREIVFALQTIRGWSPEILNAINHESIKNAVVNIALTGATLNPALQQAFLIPRKLKDKGLCCCLDFSYRGLGHIAVDSGAVINIEGRAVFEGDEFYFEYGLRPQLYHKPQLIDAEDKGVQKPRPRVIASYAVATLPSGVKQFVICDREKIERARRTSTAPNSPMWRDHYDEGAIKTAIKLLYKQLPQTKRMSEAIHVLNQHEGIDLEKPDKAKDLEQRFGFERDQKPETPKAPIEAEVVLTCPIDDTVAVLATCEKCQETQSCRIYPELKKETGNDNP